MVKNQKRRKVKVLRSDNRGEYISGKFKAHLAREGIVNQLSIPGRPEHNEQSAPAVSDYMLTC